MLNRWFLTDGFPIALCLPYHQDASLVVVSYAVAACAAYAAFQLVDRVRAASGQTSRGMWLTTAGVSMGLGIWATHFIAMLAVEIPTAIGFEVPLTVLSAGFAIAASTAAFAIVAREGNGLVGL
jgi:NO-binding membrane sensor protein with MHYT domain